MKSTNKLALIGYACGLGAGNSLCAQGPAQLTSSPLIAHLNVYWEKTLTPKGTKRKLEALASIADISLRLAEITLKLAKNKQFLVTIGGDHTCAIGTWSGIATGICPQKLGLLWIDAHLDAHTTETTPSGNIHGMPLAALLGYGDTSLTTLFSHQPNLLPENVCVIGVRSFEQGEQELLERLKVRIYYMEEILQRGLVAVFKEAIGIISMHSDYYGISLDLDAICPQEAPGVGTPEPEGLDTHSLFEAIDIIANDPRLLAAEIAEFNPVLDQENKTEKIIAHILEQFSNGIIKKRSSNDTK